MTEIYESIVIISNGWNFQERHSSISGRLQEILKFSGKLFKLPFSWFFYASRLLNFLASLANEPLKHYFPIKFILLPKNSCYESGKINIQSKVSVCVVSAMPPSRFGCPPMMLLPESPNSFNSPRSMAFN